jgi:signal transduction histidine kinase
VTVNALEIALIGVFALSGALLFGLAFLVSRYRDARGTREFATLLVLTAVWSTSAAVKLVAPRDLEAVLVSMEIVYGVFFAIAFLVFAAEYTGRSIHRRTTFALAIAACLFVVLSSLLTNPTTGLLWDALAVKEVAFPHLVFVNRGPLFWGLIGISYLMYAVGVYYLLDLHHRSRFDTTALVLIIVGILFPVIISIASATATGAIPRLDYTPLGLAVFGVATTGAINRDLFRIVPIARDTAFEFSSEGMIIVDTNHRIRDSNETARELFPALARSVGAPVTDALSVEELSFDRERTRRDEMTLHVEGTEHTVSITTAPITDGAHHLGWSIVASDITDLKRRERHLDLVARVLRHNVANEITVVNGQTEVLRQKLSGEYDEHLESIVTSASTIVRTSEKLRTIQEIVTDDRGRVPTDMGRYIRDIVTDMQAAHPAATIEAPDVDVWVESGVGLDAAIENLIENAIVHNDAENPWVRVGVTVKDTSVTVTVADDGPGIPREERRILDQGETPLQHSSGVGLWLVYRYVERSGRNLTFTRREGGGSEVSFTLDRSEAPA